MDTTLQLDDGRTVKLRVRSPESYTPNLLNTNQGQERGKAALDDSLQKSGFHRGIVVAKDDQVVNGNHAYQSASELGVVKSWIEIEVEGDVGVVTKRLDWETAQDPKAIVAAIADNRVSELNFSIDTEAFQQALDVLAEAGLELPDTLYTEAELNETIAALGGDEDYQGLTDEDEIPDEEQAETRVKRGEVWQLGRHRIMCGDSTCKADVERLMDGTIAEFCFTSPPYSAMRQYEEGTDISISHLSKIFGVWLNNCNYFVINLGLQFKDGEVVQYWDEWIKAAKDEGLKLLAWNVWDKQQMGSISSATNMFGLTHEWLFVFGESRKRLNRTVENDLEKYAKRHGEDFLEKGRKTKIRKFGGNVITDTSKAYTHHQIHSVIQVYSELSNIRDLHPATMPVGLPEQYIEAMADNTQSVVDCFLGSGSTLIACEKTGRTCYGMELSEKYCDVILQRFQDFTGIEPQKVANDRLNIDKVK